MLLRKDPRPRLQIHSLAISGSRPVGHFLAEQRSTNQETRKNDPVALLNNDIYLNSFLGFAFEQVI